MQNKLIDLAAKFFDIPIDMAERRVAYRTKNLNEDWKNKTSILNFYKKTENYIFDLIPFNSPERLYKLTYPIGKIKDKDILDFGGGIGMVGMVFSEHNNVYYYDVGENTSAFAKIVSEHFKRPITILSEKDMKEKKYDIVITADILEHIENPMKTVNMLYERLNEKGIFLTTGLKFAVKDVYPMHLKENVEINKEFETFMREKFILAFYHVTADEIIQLWIKK